MSLCQDCTKRYLCNSLCPEAEAFVNQDNVSISERLLPAIGIDEVSRIARLDVCDLERDRIIEEFRKLSKKHQVETLLKAGLTREQIAQLVGITRENLRKIISRLRKKETLLPYIEGHMPYKIEKRKGPKPWKIIRKTDGKVVGSSATKSDAQASVRARLAGEHGWRGSK